MEKIEIPIVQELERRFDLAISKLPDYYRIIYKDFATFMKQSLELSVKLLEDLANRHEQAQKQVKSYTS